MRLLLDEPERRALWEELVEAIERYTRDVGSLPVAPERAPGKLRSLLAPFDFERPRTAEAALDFVVKGLTDFQVHAPHPRYYGLFNPAPTTMGIAADALVAAFNPQLAAWSHSPLAAEIERHLVRAFAGRFGYDPDRTDGAFAGGGAEANHTAMLAALTRAFPELPRHGVRALRSAPALYMTAEGHDSLRKAARMCGIGEEAVREVGVDGRRKMRAEALREQVARDREEGLAPFMVVATAGSTASGVVDPLAELAEVALDESLWLHVDAAWGGAAVLVPELEPLLEGIARADSITFDAHKWLSVPMGGALLLTRHRRVLAQTFRVNAAYMPKEAAALEVVDPWGHTMQWSRRFIGLKLFLSLAVAGWRGYEAAIRHQTAMGERLRRGLRDAGGWRLLNDTPLPLVCFAPDPSEADGEPDPRELVDRISLDLIDSGRAWISTVHLGTLGPALRACITNYRTGPEDVDALIADLGAARRRALTS